MDALESLNVQSAIDLVVLRLCEADAVTAAHARQVAAVNSEDRFGLPFLGRIEFWLLEELEPFLDSDPAVKRVFDNWKTAQAELARRVVRRAYARLRR